MYATGTRDGLSLDDNTVHTSQFWSATHNKTSLVSLPKLQH